MSGLDHLDLAALLVATASADRAAFAELYRRTAPKLYAVTLRILGERGRAEDAVHDAYLRIWRSAFSFDAARGTPIAWLAAVARNIAIDMRRAAGTRETVGDDALDDVAAADGVSGEQLAALRACLDRLEPEQRRIVLAAYLNGESRDELAARTGRPVGTIKTWLHRALAQLKACLDG